MYSRNNRRPGEIRHGAKDTFDLRSEPSTQGKANAMWSAYHPSMGSRRATFKLRNSSPHLHVGKNTRRETLFTPLLYGAARPNMPYTYQGWTLYSRDVKLKKGPKVTIYFFSKRKPKSGKPMDEMPKNRKVGVNKRTGLPFLRKG